MSNPEGNQQTANKGFVPIGPRSLQGRSPSRNYRFVEPPGISEWVGSFFRKCLVCGMVYCIGYLQLSVGWLVGPLALLAMRDRWRRETDVQRAAAIAAGKGDEKEIILARLGTTLPPWVIFPDVERAEWLNVILKQLWPKINNYTFDLVRDYFEPSLRHTLAASYKMNSFRFESIVLGDTPMRIRGVKVYDEKKTDRGEIIMDLDVIYAGDCDFSFSVSHIKAGIKDLHLSGTLRLVLKPLMDQMPLIGGIHYYFLNSPNIDFDLSGAANLFDMPGLSDLIHRIVQEQINNTCVLPNKLFYQMAVGIDLSEVVLSGPEGIVRICAVEAHNLVAADIAVFKKASSDPYAVLSVGAQQFKTQTINKDLNPKWNFWCDALVYSANSQKVICDVWDFDAGFPGVLNDDFLGRTKVDLSVVAREGKMDIWLNLQDTKHGSVHLMLTWHGLSSNPADLQAAMAEAQPKGLSSCLLTVRLDSAMNLPLVKAAKPDAQVFLTVGKTTFTSSHKEKTVDPVFEETYSFLVHSPMTQSLVLRIVDKKSGSELGAFKQSLDMIYNRPKMRIKKQGFPVSLKADVKIFLTMEMKVLKHGVMKNLQSEEDLYNRTVPGHTTRTSLSFSLN